MYENNYRCYLLVIVNIVIYFTSIRSSLETHKKKNPNRKHTNKNITIENCLFFIKYSYVFRISILIKRSDIILYDF